MRITPSTYLVSFTNETTEDMTSQKISAATCDTICSSFIFKTLKSDDSTPTNSQRTHRHNYNQLVTMIHL